MLQFAVCESRRAEQAPLTLMPYHCDRWERLSCSPSCVFPGVAQPALQRHRESGECSISAMVCVFQCVCLLSDPLEPLAPLQVAACPRVVRVRVVQVDTRVPPDALGEPPTTAARVRMATMGLRVSLGFAGVFWASVSPRRSNNPLDLLG
jgi:hypothetical protein